MPENNSTPRPTSSKLNHPFLAPDISCKSSTKFLITEAIRYDTTDFLVFTLMGGTSLWLIISMVVAVTRLTCGW